MNDSDFAAAARPARRIILRTLMADYSLGHELLICGPVETPEQLIRAVLICCRSWRDNKTPHRWIRLWTWLRRKENFTVAIQQFNEYRVAGSTFPRVNTPKEEGRLLGAPYLARLAVFAQTMFGDAGFDQPLGMLQFMYFAHSESAGECEVENTSDRELRESIENIEADYKAEQEALKCR